MENARQQVVKRADWANLVTPSLDRLSKADRDDVQEIAASQIELLSAYHNLVLDQALKLSMGLSCSSCWTWLLSGCGRFSAIPRVAECRSSESH